MDKKDVVEELTQRGKLQEYLKAATNSDGYVTNSGMRRLYVKAAEDGEDLRNVKEWVKVFRKDTTDSNSIVVTILVAFAVSLLLNFGFMYLNRWLNAPSDEEVAIATYNRIYNEAHAEYTVAYDSICAEYDAVYGPDKPVKRTLKWRRARKAAEEKRTEAITVLQARRDSIIGEAQRRLDMVLGR